LADLLKPIEAQGHLVLKLVARPLRTARQLQEQETGVGVELLQIGILIRDNLRQKPIKVAKADELAFELILVLLEKLIKPRNGLVEDTVELPMLARGGFSAVAVPDFAELSDFGLVDDGPCLKLVLETVELVRIRHVADLGRLVIVLEGLEDVPSLVDEVED